MSQLPCQCVDSCMHPGRSDCQKIEHWFDRLARMPEVIPDVDIKYPPGEKRRVVVKRQLKPST